MVLMSTMPLMADVAAWLMWWHGGQEPCGGMVATAAAALSAAEGCARNETAIVGCHEIDK
jgi:hypothetical protein